MDEIHFLETPERAQLESYPREVGAGELATHYTMTEADLAMIRRPGRATRERLGLAMVIGTIRHLNHVPVDLARAPAAAVAFVAQQLGCRAFLEGYATSRRATRARHIQHALDHVGIRRPDEEDLQDVLGWLAGHAEAHASRGGLLSLLIDRFRAAKLLRPGPTTLERLVTRAREMSDGRVFEALRRLLEPRRQVLDDLLVANGELGGSRHGWLLERPAGNTPRDIKWMLKKHAWLVAQGVADWTLHEIHVNRMRQLARDATASTTQGLSRMVEHRRYPLLLAFLRQALIDITDVLMDMFHQCLLDVHGRAKRQMRREDEKRRSARDEIIASFAPLAAAVLNEGAVTAADIQGPVFASVPRAEVERLLELCVGSARPFDTEGLDFLRSRRNHIRQFSKMFLEQMDVRGDAEADPALLHAIEALNIVHSLKGKPLPDDAPMDFVTARWKRFVITSDGIDTAYYELCAMWGDVSNRAVLA